VVDPVAVDRWIRRLVRPVGSIVIVHARPWATVLRVPIAGGAAWFKACAAVQAFEPRLTAELSTRWPDRVVEVLGVDDERGWLLLADAGTPVGISGNPPEAWLAALPLYAELQKGEAGHVHDHLIHGVPDLRLAAIPARYAELLELDLPLSEVEVSHLRHFAPRLVELCDELSAFGLPDTIQHDDLHHMNLYARDQSMRFVDWGDASISHPFASLVVTFRFLEERSHLPPTDPWFARLRDAYLEPWGPNLAAAFALALRVGSFARAVAYIRQRRALSPEERRPFDDDFSIVLRGAVRRSAADQDLLLA
jgi:hypothetical protein